MELADQQVQDNASVSGAEIPINAPSDRNTGEGEPASKGAASPDKPEKLSLRQQIERNVEAVRTEEAKRARATDGKFTKLDGAAEKPAAAPEVQKPEANAQPEASKPVGPPSGWSKEAKAIWDQLPEAVKADAVRREAEVSKGFEEYRTKTAQLSEISQALEPLRPMLQQHGIATEAQAVKRLLEWEGSFRNPATRIQAFHQLAQQYGVDLSTLVQSPQSGSPSAAQDIPEPLRPVLDQFGGVVQEVQSIKAQLQTSEQQRIAAEFKAFADNGHPHFEAVRVAMGKLMQAGLAQDMESAYQQAIALDPTLSAQIRAEEDSKRAEEAERAKAEKARLAAAAAVSPSGRPPVGQPSAPSGQARKGASARESILSAVRELREGQRA